MAAIPWNANHNTTIEDLRAAIQALATVTTATVTGPNNRLLTVISVAGAPVTIDSIITTGGATQPTGTIGETSRSGLTFSTANG